MPYQLTKWLYAGACAAALSISSSAIAATPYLWTGAGGDENYNNPNNWVVDGDPFGPPWGSFNETGHINGNATVRVLATDPPEPFGQLLLAEQEGDNVTLIIEGGASLALYRGDNANDFGGGIDVGFNGSATFRIEPGGSLDSGYIIVRGSGNTAIIDGRGLSPTSVFLSNIPGRNSGFNVTAGNSMRIIGPNADITSNTFDLDPGATYIAEITGPSHSTFKTPTSAGAEGILQVEFNGYTPSVGDSWNLIDAPSFAATFSEIQTPDFDLPLGQGFYFKTVNDENSTYGQYGQLSFEQQLVLKVNRDTQQMSIVPGAVPVAIDGYSITSVLGGINPANWQSLDSNNVGQWRESPQNGSPHAISELNPSGTVNITTGAPLNLGSVFQYPQATAIGQELEDIQFEYYMPDGSVVQAQVIYEGQARLNDVVLFVDPVDGDAYIQHQSSIALAIDGYNIHSPSGSLLTGNSDWSSLQDQGNSLWTEAGPTANNLTELLAEGAVSLSLGTTFNLGSPFRTVLDGGTEDLIFSYLLEGDDEFTQGKVVYKEFDLAFVAGDYNRDGIVDLADYTVWRNSLNTTVPNGTGADGNNDGLVNTDDYLVWKDHFGQTIGSAAIQVSPAAVPEPATCAGLALLVAGAIVGCRIRKN